MMQASAELWLHQWWDAGISQCMSEQNPESSGEPIGRAKGGKARMAALTPEERSAQGRKGSDARWKRDEVPRATHSGVLKLGQAEIECAVLEDGRRVVTQRGMNRALGRTHGGAEFRKKLETDGGGLPVFLVAKGLKDHISNELDAVVRKPIFFRTERGAVAHGMDAELLPQICDVWINAADAGDLAPNQTKIASHARMLIRGLAHVGIIGLVDEATGYQRERAADGLARILEAFIAKELQPYVPTFPSEYYQEMFRLRGLEFPRDSVKRPQYFGVLTNDIIYKRLAPGVLDELKKVTPRLESGRHKDPLFGRLTGNRGYPKLRELLGSVVTIMSFSRDWGDFMDKLNRRHPRFGDQMMLPLDDPHGRDDGLGL